MKDGPNVATIAALIGDPARANMLTALMDGRALTVSELAETAGVALPTASGHLARLETAGLLVAERQGRHRYLRLSGRDVAEAIEVLMGLAQRTGGSRIRTGPRDAALREARVCYDHLAGERAVALASGLATHGLLVDDELTDSGRSYFEARGFVLASRGRRPLCRLCLDWSERRPHLAGALGAAIFDRVLDERWGTRGAGRLVTFSTKGGAAFDTFFAAGSSVT